MPFLRPPKPRRSTRKPPRSPQSKSESPISVHPEWEGEASLPEPRDRDVFPWPWGGQIEHTISKPIDPLDCEAWPSSPYCDPASTFNFFDFASIDIDVSANPCGGVVRISPTAFWLSLAPQTIVYRRDDPDCAPSDVPFNPPPNSPLSLGFQAVKMGSWGCMYKAAIKISIDLGPNPSPVWQRDIIRDMVIWGPLEGFEVRAIPGNERVTWSIGAYIWAHGGAAFYPRFYGDFTRPYSNPSTEFVNEGFSEASGVRRWEFAMPQFEILSFELVQENMPGWAAWGDPNKWAKAEWNRQNCGKWKQLPPPPLPYIPEESMCNCKQMESDLKSIKKLLGADKGGWKLPKSLSGRGTESVSHDNYADLMVWFAGQMSTLLGDTEIVITQKDSSLLEEGNQERQLKFENLSEAMADALGLLLENQAKVDAIYRAAAQGLAQAGVAATSATKGLEYLEDLVDFLDYETEEKSIDFPLFFTPDKDVPHEALKPSTAKLVYQAFTGKRSFNTFRFTMEQCAAIIRAVYWQRVDEDSMTRFKGSLDTLRQNANSENEGDLDTFLERIEQGFPEVPGNVDQSQPYGSPYSQRPKIRKLSQGGQPDGSNP